MTPISSAGDSVVGRSGGERIGLAIALPVLGAAVAEAINLLAPLIAGLPWAPLQGPFRLIAGLPEPYTTIVAVVVGVAAGLVLVLIAAAEAVTVRVGAVRTTITRDKSVRTLDRAEVGAVFLDEEDLVLLGRDTEVLFRRKVDLNAARLRAAFERHGYPWQEGGDPYADRYRRWVPGLPGLPPAADPLFRARAKAIERKQHDDAAELRDELAQLGVVVADRDGRQQFRQARSLGSEAAGH